MVASNEDVDEAMEPIGMSAQRHEKQPRDEEGASSDIANDPQATGSKNAKVAGETPQDSRTSKLS